MKDFPFPDRCETQGNKEMKILVGELKRFKSEVFITVGDHDRDR